MKSILAIVFASSTALVACSSLSDGSSSQAVVLDVRCAADADCPSGFECEDETEHGVTTSFCVSHDEEAAANGDCPPGYELEEEHEGTFCKAHGGDDANDDHGAGGDDAVGDDHGAGGDDAVGDDNGAGGDDAAGGGGGGATCTTDADCPAGEQCETEIENGSTTTVCKAHGGGA